MTRKERWINYMLNIIEPKPGLKDSCRRMLDDVYRRAYDHGYSDATKEYYYERKGR